MQLHERWLKKAKSDLRLARRTCNENVIEEFDAAIYHTQQCAEKTLKAFLAFNQQQIVKTHDLPRLLELCVQIDQEFYLLIDHVVFLNPFSTELRYPDDDFDVDETPTVETFEQAVLSAQNIFDFVVKKIEVSANRTGVELDTRGFKFDRDEASKR